MGAISISVVGEKKTVLSSSLIPDRRGGMLASMLGETLAGNYGGIATISLYITDEVDAEIMKTLISEVRKLLKQD